MSLSQSPSGRPPIHLLAAEADVVSGLALRVEHRRPAVAVQAFRALYGASTF
jgi:hypothetical protein